MQPDIYTTHADCRQRWLERSTGVYADLRSGADRHAGGFADERPDPYPAANLIELTF